MSLETDRADLERDGSWLERWLSPARLQRYLDAAGQDRGRALALYDWNARVSAAVLMDLAHLEVALRNAYDRALTYATPAGHRHWTFAADIVFAPLHRTKRAKGRARWIIDVNRQSREIVETAVRNAGGPSAPPGKVIANLNFGFWRYLSSKAHEKSLWVPYLHTAFPLRTNRGEVDARIGRLHELRNRVAHHEPLLDTNILARLDDLLWIADRLDPALGRYMAARTGVRSLDACRP